MTAIVAAKTSKTAKNAKSNCMVIYHTCTKELLEVDQYLATHISDRLNLW